MEGLTTRQQELLEFMRGYNRTEGTWPSVREIQKHFGFRSTNAVAGHLRLLEQKGRIRRVTGRSRTFRLPDGGAEVAPMPGCGPLLPEGAMSLVDIPLYGSIAAGYPDGVEQGAALGTLQVDGETAALRSTRRPFALRVAGESMVDAGIQDGDIVVVEPREPRNGDIVVALIDGQTTLKRYMIERGKAPYLKSENRLYPAFHARDELVIQGVATSVIRRL